MSVLFEIFQSILTFSAGVGAGISGAQMRERKRREKQKCLGTNVDHTWGGWEDFERDDSRNWSYDKYQNRIYDRIRGQQRRCSICNAVEEVVAK